MQLTAAGSLRPIRRKTTKDASPLYIYSVRASFYTKPQRALKGEQDGSTWLCSCVLLRCCRSEVSISFVRICFGDISAKAIVNM